MTVDDILTKHALRATSARKVVLACFLQAPFPLAVSDLEKHISKQEERIDTVTLYRMMDTFVEKGIVEKLELNEGKFRYELAGRAHHHHILCTTCGAMADVSDCVEEELVTKVAQKTKFEITSHALAFYGLCKKCQA